MSFGSTSEDIDGVPKSIDRGPPEEMRMTENELRGAMQDIANARHSVGEVATIKGLQAEMKVLRQLLDDCLEQNNKLVSLYGTLRGEFEQYRAQRAVELQSWLARGGSTTPEDVDGSQS